MSKRDKVTRAEIEYQWNMFQDEVIAHAHDYTRREHVINKYLPDLSYMIEHCDDITVDGQALISQLDEHIRKLGLEAMPTKLLLLDVEQKLRSSQPNVGPIKKEDDEEPKRLPSRTVRVPGLIGNQKQKPSKTSPQSWEPKK